MRKITRQLSSMAARSAMITALSIAPSVGLVSLVAPVPAFAKADPKEEKKKTNPPLDQVVDDSTLYGSYLAAILALKENDDIAAREFLNKAHSLDPDDEDIREKLFLALLSNGNIGEAVDLSTKISKKSKVQNMVTFVSAIQALRERSWDQVNTIIDGLSGGDLDNMMVGFLKAWAAFGNGKPKEAIKIGDSIEGPEWMEIVKNYQTGLMAAANGDDVNAIVRFRKVIDTRPAASILPQIYLRAVEATIRALTRMGNWEAARATLADGIELFPGHSTFAELGAAIERKESLRPLISNPQEGVGELFLNVGSAIRRNDNSQFSRTYLQIANYMNGKDPLVILAIADIYKKQQQYKLADDYYQKIGAKSGYYRQAQLEKALNLNQMGKKDEAILLLRNLVQQQPEDLISSMALAHLYAMDENYKAAADVYDKAVGHIKKVEDYHWNLFYRRGIAYERLKEWAKAEPNFRKALELAPKQPDVLNYLGYSLVDMNRNVEEGMEMIKQAVQLKPRSGYIIDSLGWAHYRLGQYDDAVRELEKAVDLMPDDPTVNEHLGDAYWKVGRKLEAGFQWNHALNGEPKIDEETRKKIEEKIKNGLSDATEAREVSPQSQDDANKAQEETGQSQGDETGAEQDDKADSEKSDDKM